MNWKMMKKQAKMEEREFWKKELRNWSTLEKREARVERKRLKMKFFGTIAESIEDNWEYND